MAKSKRKAMRGWRTSGQLSGSSRDPEDIFAREIMMKLSAEADNYGVDGAMQAAAVMVIAGALFLAREGGPDDARMALARALKIVDGGNYEVG